MFIEAKLSEKQQNRVMSEWMSECGSDIASYIEPSLLIIKENFGYYLSDSW